MKTIPITQFRAHCLELLDRVRRTKERLIVTKRGIPIAEVVPAGTSLQDARHPLRGTIIYEGDIVSPLGIKWKAAR